MSNIDKHMICDEPRIWESDFYCCHCVFLLTRDREDKLKVLKGYMNYVSTVISH